MRAMLATEMETIMELGPPPGEYGGGGAGKNRGIPGGLGGLGGSLGRGGGMGGEGGGLGGEGGEGGAKGISVQLIFGLLFSMEATVAALRPGTALQARP